MMDMGLDFKYPSQVIPLQRMTTILNLTSVSNPMGRRISRAMIALVSL